MSAPVDRGGADIKVGALDELRKFEPDILKRIAGFPNGGHLFLAHPFRLLRDIGVELAPAVEAEILRLQPEISGLSAYVYDQIKASPPQAARIRVSGLFRATSGRASEDGR